MNIFSLRMIAFVLFTGCIVHSGSTAEEKPVNKAALKLLNNQDLIAAFSGKTHVGFYRDYLERYGSVKFVEHYQVGGTLTYQGGDITTAGFWEVTNNHICFDYDNEKFLPGCFIVVKKQGCYYSYESDPDVAFAGTQNQEWWIFSHIQGESVSCEEADLLS